ncbi:alpha-N-acetylgalactosaminidase-like [Synchiropus splendidus]|uniref:alpha-N-acetylgalactosaminidase-like n=1 Tax=Synchiropus splendidus TaxID=270530 RepID=UPI00237EB9D9|nr:alpha-N-acetylgalactosaminidase-like [Synchiropus splendidus]XP_053736826.1 alpha-N-acetylgalactosaminidase-like [Synchiropus splendidus]
MTSSVVTLLMGLVSLTISLDNGLLKTPPMGWMAWERFRCDIDCKEDPKNCISENLFRDMADRLAEDGWRELGYEYVMIDDCWMSMQRDEQGRLKPDPSRFPGGIATLARYLHDRGLKLGIYADMGSATCMGYPGTTLERIQTDAQTFASWGVDYLKFDGCNSNAAEQMLGYPLMSRALNATGRAIAYSCSWPAYLGGLPPSVNYTLLGQICNLWRNYDDIQDSWDSVVDIIDWFSKNQDILQPAAGAGQWNDPDMLIIGNFGLSLDQARSQMALWAVMAAPLIMSNDLRSLDNSVRAILQNKVAIAINQDPMGVQGRRLLQEKSQIEVYWRPLAGSASALVFLSRRTDMPFLYRTSLGKLNYDAGDYEAYDVFSGALVKGINTTTALTISVNPSGVVMWYVYPKLQRAQHQWTSSAAHHTVL